MKCENYFNAFDFANLVLTKVTMVNINQMIDSKTITLKRVIHFIQTILNVLAQSVAPAPFKSLPTA